MAAKNLKNGLDFWDKIPNFAPNFLLIYNCIMLTLYLMDMIRTNTRNIEPKQRISSTKTRFGLLVALMVCTIGAWGQTDFSGFYYIANNNTNAFNTDDPTNNWYLVPASDCGGPTSLDTAAWAWDEDGIKPFLTTYQTRQDNNPICLEDYNSVWQIVKVEGEDFYYIKHYNTGKYIVYNDPVYSTRRAFHLETIADPGTYVNSDYIKFAITYIGSNGTKPPFNICPKNLVSSTSNRFLNPSNGNMPNYYGITNTSNNQIYVKGLIGIYNSKTDNGSKWYLEVPRPVILFDNVTHMVSISSTLDALNPNYTFYYN